MLGLIQSKRSGNFVNGDLVIQLADIAGVGSVRIKDRDGATAFSVDSKGNVKWRGTQGKI